MIQSMTGFGDASDQVDGVHYAIELRSLNNKYFKFTSRLPDELLGLEAELESTLRRQISRGSLSLNVKLRVVDSQAASRINEEMLLSYLDHLETVHGKVSDRSLQIDLTQLLTLPGVLQPAMDERALLAQARPVVIRLADQAAGKLKAMREVEGQSLVNDLNHQLQVVRQRAEEVSQRAPQVVEEYHQRLHERVRELADRAELDMDKGDLWREVAIFADRSDISEELTRIRGHLDQFAQKLAGDHEEPAGRTLDFIAQELLREANTVGSKSNDAQISRHVVEIKSAIDRIKEQVQNVE